SGRWAPEPWAPSAGRGRPSGRRSWRPVLRPFLPGEPAVYLRRRIVKGLLRCLLAQKRGTHSVGDRPVDVVPFLDVGVVRRDCQGRKPFLPGVLASEIGIRLLDL